MTRTKQVQVCLLAATVLAVGATGALANCTETGGFAVFQCANLAYFAPPPAPITVAFDAAGRPTNMTLVFWQIGFGNGTINNGQSSSGTGNSGATTFNGNDGGFLGVNIRNAKVATGQMTVPTGATCISTLNWADTGIDGCSDNNRVAALNNSDDGLLNAYFDWYEQTAGGGPGYYSLNWQQDYPMAVLMKTPAAPFTCDTSAKCDQGTLLCVGGPRNGQSCSALRDLECGFCSGGPNANARCGADHQCADASQAEYFAFAVIATLNRGNTGGNGACSASPGTNPAPCDLRPGYYDFTDIKNGNQNPLTPTLNNVIPWQPIPAPVESNRHTDPNNAGFTLVDLTWNDPVVQSDDSVRPSTNPGMGGLDCTGLGCPGTLTDGTRAPGVGVVDIVTKFGPLVRYRVATASDANFSTPLFTTEITGNQMTNVSVPSQGCYRLQTLFGKKPDTATTSTANCRLGKCGDVGYLVQSPSVCLGSGGCTPTGAEICDGLDNDCDGSVDGFATTCGVGACASTGTCTAGVDSCTAGTATTEICNNIDDDCNGTTDDFDTTCGQGVCAATGHCTAGVDSCTAGAPGTEVCNNLDDDCDGTVDDGNPGGGALCPVVGQLGECEKGQSVCQGGAISCMQVNQPVAEICDNLDNNCDGTIDSFVTTCGAGACASTGTCTAGADTCVPITPTAEICDNVDNDCNGTVDDLGSTSCGIGACQVTVQNCIAGVPQTCTPGVPVAEICNNIDDDCDGAVDSFATSCGVGACASTGTCNAGVNTCVAGTPTTETCNNIDDDCNGAVDGFATTCGVGACAAAGTCAAGVDTCVAGAPTAEICNNADDNCDGQTDENLGSSTCGTGACQMTVPNCVGGVPQVCTPGTPVAETCNNIDDNCDGTVDGFATSCGVGACASAGTCTAGVNSCTPGAPTAETCNNVDDDCDGTVDDGNPGAGIACNTGLLGVCMPGLTTCSGGTTSCVQNVQPSAETCPANGLDEDCNGTPDDVAGGCGLAIIDPNNGDELDCTPGALPPTVEWNAAGYDKFRVFISWDPNFSGDRKISSGDTWLRTTEWTVPVKKWAKLCTKANPSLYFRVDGVNVDVNKKDPTRKATSPTVTVTVDK